MKYFEVQVEVEMDVANNKVKKVKEIYLVDAQSVTEAEARTVEYFRKSGIQLNFEVVAAKPSKVLDVVS